MLCKGPQKSDDGFLSQGECYTTRRSRVPHIKHLRVDLSSRLVSGISTAESVNGLEGWSEFQARAAATDQSLVPQSMRMRRKGGMTNLTCS